MKKNMDEAMKTSCSGLTNGNPIVRYAALSCTGLLLSELSPTAQKKYHQELLPVLMEMMKNEKFMKVKAQSISCTINFMRGLTDMEDDEVDELLANYTE